MTTVPACAVVLAAGVGSRMKSDQPKVLHPVAGRSLLAWSLAAARAAAPDAVAVVIGPDAPAVAAEAHPADVFVQNQRRGTGDAVAAARPAITGRTGDVFVLFGDTPFVRPETLDALRAARRDGAAIAVLGFRPADPARYGRLIRGVDGALDRIVEAADASAEELAADLCNSGVMCLDAEKLPGWLDRLTADNAQGEYYLTDVVALARADGLACAAVEGDPAEMLGVNDRAQLAEAEAAAQAQLRAAAMAEGATLIAPETVFFCWDTRLGRDVVIHPHVVFGPAVTVGDRVQIKSFSHLEGAVLADDVVIGPFARLRPGANLERRARVGNFVEIKKARLGEGAKVNHLAYVGDADIGAAANVGAGVITCNYDGFRKHETVVGDGAFIGSNCALVAPVTVGDGAIIGAGSVVTRDVAEHALAVARGRQTELPGWAERFRDQANEKG
ncbi:MAG: bifunctional UDP-N-acetylglucosamine diphosphorylase/glucosamine-1-phosphate N-acetyltransferase GlmU [Pseudomonadota bacterium]